MSTYMPVFTSPAAAAECQAAYQAVLDCWPCPYTELDLPTSFGLTHVIASGSLENPPLVLMHAMFATATAWYANMGELSEHFRVYAVDVIGEPNRSCPSGPIASMDAMTRWFEELLDQLGIEQTYLAGNSYGAFMSAYYAMRLPERVRKLALIGPAATFCSMPPFYIHTFIPKLLYLFLPWLPGKSRMMQHAVEWVHAGLPKDGAWDRLFYQIMMHGLSVVQIFPKVYTKDELSQIQAPTLLLLGDHEKVYSQAPEKVGRMAQALMPNLQVEIIPHAHHITALAAPEAVNRRLVNFFSS